MEFLGLNPDYVRKKKPSAIFNEKALAGLFVRQRFELGDEKASALLKDGVSFKELDQEIMQVIAKYMRQDCVVQDQFLEHLKQGNKNAAEKLLGADVSIQDALDQILIDATEEGDVVLFKQALELGASHDVEIEVAVGGDEEDRGCVRKVEKNIVLAIVDHLNHAEDTRIEMLRALDENGINLSHYLSEAETVSGAKLLLKCVSGGNLDYTFAIGGAIRKDFPDMLEIFLDAMFKHSTKEDKLQMIADVYQSHAKEQKAKKCLRMLRQYKKAILKDKPYTYKKKRSPAPTGGCGP